MPVQNKALQIKPSFLQSLALQSEPHTHPIALLHPHLAPADLLALFSLKQDFFAMVDAKQLHAETVHHAEKKLFDYYSEIARAAKGRPLLLPMPAVGIGNGTLREGLLSSFLTAALRISAMGRVSLFFPFIQSPEELPLLRRKIHHAMAELCRRDLPFDELTELGVEITTPAAALRSRHLADEVDLLHVDLDSLARHIIGSSPRTPEDTAANAEIILQFCEIAVGNAHAAGRFVSVGGTLAEHPLFLPHLLAMGADGVTVSPFL